MSLSRGLSLGARLILGLLLAGALVHVTHLDFQDPGNAWRRPFIFPLLGLISIFSALLIQSFCRRFNIFEVLVSMVFVFLLGCLMFPPVFADHSRRNHRVAPVAEPGSVPIIEERPS